MLPENNFPGSPAATYCPGRVSKDVSEGLGTPWLYSDVMTGSITPVRDVLERGRQSKT